MTAPTDQDAMRDIAEQAANCRATLNGGSQEQKAAAWKWALQSPEHLRRIIMDDLLERELPYLNPEHRLSLENDSPGNSPLSHQNSDIQLKHLRRSKLAWGVAAGVAILASAALAWQLQLRGIHKVSYPTYSTQIGEKRAITLTDGSTVTLDAQSRATIRFSGRSRDIDLSGQAFFRVAHDSGRPFQVHAGNVMVTALATQFDVRSDSDQVATISVIEGAVEVSSTPESTPIEEASGSSLSTTRRLAAGHKAQVDGHGQITDEAIADRAAVTAWQQGRLVFLPYAPLKIIVREFNRYTPGQRIRIEGDTLAERRFGGMFDAADPGPLLAKLALDPTVEVDRRPREVVIRERVTATHP